MPKLKEDVTNTIEIKKSKFITYLHRCESEEDAKEFLKYYLSRRSNELA